VCRQGMLVHCPSRLNAASRVLAIELHCGDGVFTKSALELGKAVHLFDDVMSHSFNCRPYPWHDPELKFSRMFHPMKIGAAVETACAGQDLGSNENMPRGAGRGVSSHTALFPGRLLRKHAASHLRFSVDLGAESRCPVVGFSWKYPVQGCPGSDFPVRVYPSYPRCLPTPSGLACPVPVCSGFFQFRYS
jgi:hypothetical protein